MQDQQAKYVTLSARETSFVLACAIGTRPQIIYWGPRLSETAPHLLDLMGTRQHAHGSPDEDIPASLLNETGGGLSGLSGFIAHRAGKDWATLFTVESIERPSRQALKIICIDAATRIRAVHEIAIDPDSGIITCQTGITNLGANALSIDWCAAICLPLDQRATRLFGFTGRWAGEFSIEEIPAFTGAYVRENKSGRTSHDNFPGLIAATQGTAQQNGLAYGFHLGWSGNNRVRVDRLTNGRAFVQMGEYFYPGEMVLAQGETYQSPPMYIAASNAGLNSLSNQFHTHLRRSVMGARLRDTPRPIHYNTWEAIYFNHDEAKLFKLAQSAADIGAERFILDDGWFGGRRHDKAGLGDWWVSKDVYPQGLDPLIKKVTGLGMAFGLWLEPEMVNPDSELYRNHPDWVLHAPNLAQISSRNQYALDLTRTEVCDYLFGAIHKLLSAYDISYIKWDMNRDVHHPGSGGRAAASRQTHALYQLLARLKSTHPGVEIESCSSGGARADYGILRYTDRIWTSDSNDALDRQRIQRGASYFFPLEVMGAHVGPKVCHITGRTLSMNMRVATAFFGHMGMELNLFDEDAADLEVLKAGLALHKKHRALLHSGDLMRLDTPAHVNAFGVVAPQKDQALFSWANLTGHRETLPGRIYFAGLSQKQNYRAQIIWPSPVHSRTSPSIIERAKLDKGGIVLSGEALMQAGLQAPLLYPETCLIYHLQAT